MIAELTDRELDRAQRAGWPSTHPRYRRKVKLRMRYAGDRLDKEIEWTQERLAILLEIKEDREKK